ncbi:MAG: hypothetical protein VKL41_17585 [Snowella sp.]|nr:hypothetical protein [Snowella sp.]
MTSKCLSRYHALTVTLVLWGMGNGICPLSVKSEPAKPPTQTQLTEDSLDLSPEIMENSPVLQRWRKEVPDLLEEIKNDPSFRTRIRLGYNLFPSSNNTSGVGIGIEDLFIGKSSLTLSGDYETSFSNRQSGGVNANYYLLPLGSYINIAPVVGYRYIQTNDYHTQGMNVGAKIMLALSRSGAADLAFSQSFISSGSDNEVGISTLSVGYALSNNLRISTDLQQQNSRAQKDNQVGLYLEWMPPF